MGLIIHNLRLFATKVGHKRRLARILLWRIDVDTLAGKRSYTVKPIDRNKAATALEGAAPCCGHCERPAPPIGDWSAVRAALAIRSPDFGVGPTVGPIKVQ